MSVIFNMASWFGYKKMVNLLGTLVYDRLKGARSPSTLFFFFFLIPSWLLMRFYAFIDWSFALPDSCTPPPPELQIRCSHLAAVVQVPGVLSLIDRLLHWWLVTRPKPPPETQCRDIPLEKAPSQHPPPTPIYPSLHIFIHPSICPHQPPTLQP